MRIENPLPAELTRIICTVAVLFFAASGGYAASVPDVRAHLAASLKAAYGAIERSPVSSGLLRELAVPFARVEELDGRPDSPPITFREWLQVSHELRRSALSELELPSHDFFREASRLGQRRRVHSISVLNFRYHRIRNGLPLDSVFSMENGIMRSIAEDALVEARVFASACLTPATYRGGEVRFRVDLEDFYFTNVPAAVNRLEIDFDDGQSFQEIRTDDVVVQYRTTGRKIIRLRATLDDGEVLQARFYFDVITLTTPNPTDTLFVQSAIPYNGEYSTGEAYIYLSGQHNELTRPVIVSEGFDLDNSMYWDELYALLNQEELIETLRAVGFDAVVLNYTQSITYIQSNAYLVEALIDAVNQQIPSDQTTVLVGASMGGLTTCYALAHMESENRAHRVRTLITFDTPHRGANIPLGVQYWMDFFADESADAAMLRDALNSPAARQMLLAHFTDPPSSVPAPDPLRAVLLNDYTQLGEVPALPRLIAVANGSGLRRGMDFAPGAQLILYEYRSLLLDITGNVWALHNTHAQQIFDGEINLIWPFPDEFLTVTVQPAWPWDNAPGGMRYTMAQMDSAQVDYGDVIALHQNHCFIPTVSALGLDVEDPFHDIAGDPNLYSHTLFDALYFPQDNQEHVLVTPENFWWLIGEICDSLPAPIVVAAVDNGQLRLTWTRTAATRSYHVYVSANSESWPQSFAVTADTTWLDPDTTSLLKFYRVESSTEPVGSMIPRHAGRQKEPVRVGG